MADGKMAYASEVSGSLGFRALRAGALVAGLEAVLSPNFFRLLEGREGPEEELDVAPRLFFGAAGTGFPVARGGSSWICPLGLADAGKA